MKIERLRWTVFRIPFRGSYATAGGEMTFREGIIIRLTTDAGVVGLGEASPLPHPGGSAVEETAKLLDRIAPSIIGRDAGSLWEFLQSEVTPDNEPPAWRRAAFCAVRAGLDIAACDSVARGAGVSVAQLLARTAAASVAVNALVSAPTAAGARESAAEALRAGFGSVKLKVGIARSLEAESERVMAVRQALGADTLLRLDANGAWSVDQAIRTITALECYDLEFVEQPVPPDDLSGMRRVGEAVDTPIAADECVTGTDAARRVLEAGAAQVLVLKPMVVGGLSTAREIIGLAAASDVSVAVSTSIDSGVGTAAALHLAATLPAAGPACGLATAGLLESDLLARPSSVREGEMTVPSGPGLGVALDEEQMERYAVEDGEAP